MDFLRFNVLYVPLFSYESTRQKPARELNLPLELLYGRSPEPERSEKIDNYVDELQEKLEDIHKFARARIQIASE